MLDGYQHKSDLKMNPSINHVVKGNMVLHLVSKVISCSSDHSDPFSSPIKDNRTISSARKQAMRKNSKRRGSQGVECKVIRL